MTVNHPAKFSAPILPEISTALDTHADGRRLRVLDPFAGTGLIHTITQHDTWAVEIEPEWATMHPRTIVGDATRLPFPTASFDAVATSPTYANRLADQYDGRDGSRRYTYRLSLGRPLHPRNTGRMNWGTAYWHMHWSAWIEARRVTRPGGLLVVNLSNHVRKGHLVNVVGWHRARLTELGFVYLGSVEIETRRMRHGANHEARDEAEYLLTFTAPGIPRS